MLRMQGVHPRRKLHEHVEIEKREGYLMNTLRSIVAIRRFVVVAVLACMVWLPALPTQAAEVVTGDAIPSAPMKEIGNVASGAAEDTLKACVARIPKDASVGQRMMAELSCDRDEETRKSIDAVPGR